MKSYGDNLNDLYADKLKTKLLTEFSNNKI